MYHICCHDTQSSHVQISSGYPIPHFWPLLQTSLLPTLVIGVGVVGLPTQLCAFQVRSWDEVREECASGIHSVHISISAIWEQSLFGAECRRRRPPPIPRVLPTARSPMRRGAHCILLTHRNKQGAEHWTKLRIPIIYIILNMYMNVFYFSREFKIFKFK